MKTNALGLLKRLIKEIGDDDLSGIAAEMAYRFFLALFPFFLFIAAVGGLAAEALGVQNPTGRIMDAIGQSLPPDSAAVLRHELTDVVSTRNPTLASLSIIGAIWAASSGFNTVMKGMNRALGVRETRPMWKRYAISLGLTAFGGVAIIASFTVIVLGQVAGLTLVRDAGLSDAGARIITLARWPVTIFLLLIATDFIFWAAPNVHLPFRWITPGAAFFAVSWLVFTFAFGLYVGNFGAYGATYGALGSVVVLLLWFYLTAFILLLGAELNAVLARGPEPQDFPPQLREGSPHLRSEPELRSPSTP